MVAPSNNTVKRRIVEIADNIEETVSKSLKRVDFFFSPCKSMNVQPYCTMPI